MNLSSSDTFPVNSIFASMMETGWQSKNLKNVETGFDGGRPVKSVIGATFFRCGEEALFSDDWKNCKRWGKSY